MNVDGTFVAVGGAGLIPFLKAYEQAHGPIDGKKFIGNLFWGTPGQFEQLKKMQESTQKGFGSVVSLLPGRVIVLQTLPGTPSAKAGLMPGDVITTGTPPGVGLGMKPPSFLKAGDVVTLGIQGLGGQRQRVVAFKGRRMAA